LILSHHARTPVSRGRAAARSIVGAALVEFAFVAMFLLVLLGGTYDYGMAWRLSVITNEAARGGARTGSALGKSYLADWSALSNAKAALVSANKLSTVQLVVIYKSTAANGAAPAGCLTGTSTTATCNVLTGAQFSALAQSDFNTTTGCINSTKAVAANWCPSSRNNTQLTADYYGFLVKTQYTKQFKAVGGAGPTATRYVVMRLEPST
jgi:Flp pilus assembly protein TadG